MIDYVLILETKYKGNQWTLHGDSYEGLIWHSDTPKPTREELDSQWEEVLSIQKQNQCKNTAKQLLLDSDWSELPSVIEVLENANEWKSYRVQLRKYVVTPVQSPVFPSVPQVKWKEV